MFFCDVVCSSILVYTVGIDSAILHHWSTAVEKQKLNKKNTKMDMLILSIYSETIILQNYI